MSDEQSRLYEKVLEMSKARVGELTWNNILFEANLELKGESEADPEQVSLLQTQIQGLHEELTTITNERDTLVEKYGSVDIDQLQQILEDNKKLQSLRDQVNSIGVERNDLRTKLDSSTKTIEKLGVEIQNSNQQIQALSSESANIEELQTKNESLQSELIQEKSKSSKYNDLQSEFSKREDKFNQLQNKLKDSNVQVNTLSQEKNDVESALLTQKKLYEELVEREKQSEETITKLKEEIVTLKRPKKRGRPKKEVESTSLDGGSLETVSL